MDWKDALAKIQIEQPDSSSCAENIERQNSAAAVHSSKPVMTLFYEKRRGRPSTVIAGYAESCSESKQLASVLKQRLACGGSERDGEILLQGDVRNTVREILKQNGYKVKN